MLDRVSPAETKWTIVWSDLRSMPCAGLELDQGVGVTSGSGVGRSTRVAVGLGPAFLAVASVFWAEGSAAGGLAVPVAGAGPAMAAGREVAGAAAGIGPPVGLVGTGVAVTAHTIGVASLADGIANWV